ncbi:MAG: mitochondrial fission ELM1 family protein [Proteobacteria bacterium]|nr:mitochondrial fission ELM1 family protein [Pseudomonadota bacterium]
MIDAATRSELAAARRLVAGARCWVLSDGKIGDEVQCLGVAEALGLAAEVRRVAPRKPWVWLMPWGGIDPAEAPAKPGSPLAAPYPDIAIASGRRTVSYLRHVKRASGGKTFTVYLKDPRSGAGSADFLWVPQHDRLRGENVLVTLTSPHRLSPERLLAARAAPPYGLDRLPHPRVALVIGGNSHHHRFTDADIADFAGHVRQLAEAGAGLMATASRRTPPSLAGALRTIVTERGGFFWDGTGENPYPAMLALADAVVVTADSVNMVGEALVTGKPVHIVEPSGGSAKITKFLSELRAAGLVRPFAGRIEGSTYTPVDATQTIAVALAQRFAAVRAQLKDLP